MSLSTRLLVTLACALTLTAATAQDSAPRVPSQKELDAILKNLQGAQRQMDGDRAAAPVAPPGRGTKGPSGAGLQAFLPARLPGWIASPQDDAGIHDPARVAMQEFSSDDQERRLGFTLTRASSALELPRLDQTPVGRSRESRSTETRVVEVAGRRGVLHYDHAGRGGELQLVAGLCLLRVDAGGVAPEQITSAAGAVRWAELERSCAAPG